MNPTAFAFWVVMFSIPFLTWGLKAGLIGLTVGLVLSIIAELADL